MMPQEAIYTDLIAEINAAKSMFNASQPTFGSADLIYGGDIDQWTKFANSLLIRLGMRLSEVDPATAEDVVSKAALRTCNGSLDRCCIRASL